MSFGAFCTSSASAEEIFNYHENTCNMDEMDFGKEYQAEPKRFADAEKDA